LRDPNKQKRTTSDGFPPDPELVKLMGLISEALKQDCKGKDFCDVELIHRFRDAFKASEDDVKVALSNLINRGEIVIRSVCFLRVNTVHIPE